MSDIPFPGSGITAPGDHFKSGQVVPLAGKQEDGFGSALPEYEGWSGSSCQMAFILNSHFLK